MENLDPGQRSTILFGLRQFLSTIHLRFLDTGTTIDSTRKDSLFHWTPAAQLAFETLKKSFTLAPILLHPDPTKPFTVETDASDFAIDAILSQPDVNGVLHPVAFYSRKFMHVKINYPIYDKELSAIIFSFEE
jgi:hypothetical protein